MKLTDYLTKTKTRQARFAEMIGRNQSSVSRIVSGAAIPDPETIRRIAEATKNKVTANDFIHPVDGASA